MASTHACPTQAAWNGLQSQNRMASVAATCVAVDQSERHDPVGAAARRAGARIGTESAVGFRHYQYPSVGWSKGPLSSHDRLCEPHGVGLAIRPTHYGHRSHRDASEALWRRFGDARIHARGIEFLNDNGPEYTSHRFWPFVRAMGLTRVIRHDAIPNQTGSQRRSSAASDGTMCIKPAWRRSRTWRSSYRPGSSTTISGRRTVLWPCSRQPSTMRNGLSEPKTYLSKIRWAEHHHEPHCQRSRPSL